MLHKTRGIVFHVTDYSETSLIASVFTEEFGLRSYLISGARRKGSKVKPSLLQPLSLLELVVYEKESRGLQRISEVKSALPFTSIPSDPLKTSILFFLNEIIYKTVREEESNPGLFEFIFSSLRFLDETRESCNDFHIAFLIHLTKHLGFFPQAGYSNNTAIFDLKEGIFVSQLPAHPFAVSAPLSAVVHSFLSETAQDSYNKKIPSPIRKELLKTLLDYYSLHVTGFSHPKSQRVLEEVLR